MGPNQNHFVAIGTIYNLKECSRNNKFAIKAGLSRPILKILGFIGFLKNLKS